jgi:hypothetical protein
MAQDTFEVLLLNGRPASGKSEIIDFLTHLPSDIRQERYHVATLDVLDDFPMLWAWFEQDYLLSQKLGLPRLYTDKEGYFLENGYWHLLIERLNLDYEKRLRDDPDYHQHTTTLIEFSRGSQHGGYAKAYAHLSDEVWKRAGIVYVSVSFEESLRKNRRRFNPDKPDSILEHGLPDEKMERLYGKDDWEVLAPETLGLLTVGDCRVPYAVFENEDDVTTGKPDLLAARLQETLDKLWELRRQM